jgi:hypothetical protein
MDKQSIIRAYKRRNLPKALVELNYFRDLPNFNICIDKAALAIDHRGKRYRHQTRFSKVTLLTARDILLDNAKSIKEVKNFDELICLIGNILESVKGIGELYIYDTSLRIGSYLGYLPKKVYLHSGTRKGARKLGYKNRYVIEMKELPNEFQYLEPFEVEDILCIYKKKFDCKQWEESENGPTGIY